MQTAKRVLTTTELLLILPAALFMAALLARTLQPLDGDAARVADRIVTWYADRQWTLWILLIALPLTVLITGCATLIRGDAKQSFSAIGKHPATLFVAAATLASGVFLGIAVLHMLAN